MPVLRYCCKDCGKRFEFDAAENEIFGDAIVCPFCLKETARLLDTCASSTATGVYKYNKHLGRTIKVSDCVPGLSGGCAGCSGGNCSSCNCHH